MGAFLVVSQKLQPDEKPDIIVLTNKEEIMASEVFSTEELKLQDGTEVTVRPLAIGRLRRFFEAWGEIEKVQDNDDDDGFDVYINCSGIALEHNFKGKFEGLRASPEEKKNGEFLNPE